MAITHFSDGMVSDEKIEAVRDAISRGGLSGGLLVYPGHHVN